MDYPAAGTGVKMRNECANMRRQNLPNMVKFQIYFMYSFMKIRMVQFIEVPEPALPPIAGVTRGSELFFALDEKRAVHYEQSS